MNRKLLLLSMTALFSLTACGKSNENISSDLEEVVAQEPIIDSNGSLKAVITTGGYEISLADLAHQTGNDNDSLVYYTSAISSDALMKIYKALGRTPAEGDKVAVKLHTGEGDGSYNLDPDFIKELVQSVNGTIVESNTAYGGNRSNTAMHMQIARIMVIQQSQM